NSPTHELGYRFPLCEQTGDLPASVDFDKLINNLPDRDLSEREQEFVFRATAMHWSIQYRYVFRSWSTPALLDAATRILEDRALNKAHKSKPGQSHPARHAIDVLGATDEYRSKADSEVIARFLLSWVPRERRPSVFFHCLDIL